MSVLFQNGVDLREEMVAYELLHSLEGNAFKKASEDIAAFGGRPSAALTGIADLHTQIAQIQNLLAAYTGFEVCVSDDFHFPLGLKDDKIPSNLFYYKGDIGLLDSRLISIVGARSAGKDGLMRAKRLAKGLVKEGFTIVSGLAEGIDTAAMTAAEEAGGRLVGVIGTPITEYYPKKNREFQDRIANKHLLISEVPFLRYANEHFKMHRQHFPLRNRVMSAISEATIIVEASEKSGTLTQARAAIQQGRKLFILNSCFENPTITWPSFYENKGAIRVNDFDDILSNLEGAKSE